MRSLALTIAAVVLGSLLVAAPPATAAAGQMTEYRAGRYYVNHVCPPNLMGDKFYRVIWRGRPRITKREVARRLPELRRLSDDYARVQYNWARAMYNPPADWPTSVAYPVRRLANVSLRHSDLLYRQAGASSAGQWLNLNGRINNLSWGNYAANIRARLDLPRRTNCRR